MIPAKAHKAPALCVLTGIKSEKYERGIVMKTIDIAENTGIYASKWGISDFYEEAEKSLRDVLNSGEDFRTDWFGCKKEIHYAQITREAGIITVSVSCHMDDLWDGDDLIYDALWEVTKSENELPEEIIDSIRDAAMDDNVEDSSTWTEVLPPSASFDDVVKALDKCEANAGAENTGMYKRLCEIVYDHVEYMKEQGISFTSPEEDEI